MRPVRGPALPAAARRLGAAGAGIALLAAAAIAGCSSAPQRREPTPPTGAATLAEHLRALARIAARHGGERALGTPGYAASVGYVARRLREAGWRVEVQPLPLLVPAEVAAPRLAIEALGRLRALRDFRALDYSRAGAGSGPVRTAADGCSAARLARLAGGELALVRRGGCVTLVKARNAARAGALALLVRGGSGAGGVPSSTLVSPAPLPVLAVADGVARRIEDGERASFRVSTVSARGMTQNVIAEAGAGERVAMAGAHLDSVPHGAGMDDNASGVAALLATAQALGRSPPGRVRLAFWGAEEVGLVGSRHYVRSLSRAQRREIAAYLNLDMVGSPNAVAGIYRDGDPHLTRVLRASHPGREAGVSAGGRSDHAPFQDAGIAVSGFYTGSEEPGPGGRPRDPCYHRTCDTLRNVDLGVLLGMTRATAAALRRLARQAK